MDEARSAKSWPVQSHKQSPVMRYCFGNGQRWPDPLPSFWERDTGESRKLDQREFGHITPESCKNATAAVATFWPPELA